MDYSTKAVLSRHSRIDTHMNSHRLWEQAQDYIYSNQWEFLDSIPPQRGGSGYVLPPLCKNLSEAGTHLQQKLSLLQRELTPVLTRLDVRPYTQEMAKQKQHNDIFVVFVSYSSTQAFYLTSFFHVYLVSYFVFF